MKTPDMRTVSFTTKGQIVIPVSIRHLYGIDAGTRAVVTATRNGILIKPITHAVIDAGCGILQSSDASSSIAEERAIYKLEERKLEERRARRRT